MCVVVGGAHKKGPEKPSFAFGVIQCHREGWMEEGVWGSPSGFIPL